MCGEEPPKTLSDADAIEGECTRCGAVRDVWPLEQPADIVLELDWGYARFCLDCWRDMGGFIVDNGSDDAELTDHEEWEAHNEQFSYDPPKKPGDAWSPEEYQELCDRVISRRTEWFCDKCSGRGPIRRLQKARRHVEKHHGADLIEQYETPRDELETATDGGTTQDQVAKRSEENHGLSDYSGGESP